ncbi:MAG TPA: hypothetical protein VFD58_30260 [Blastocatellia bacterium]|nr:hypothetical protein [Blastocatellia bacterium]
MSDYLTNLAARSFDPAPMLQPRLRSRFEPAERSDALPFAPPEIEAELSAPVAARPASTPRHDGSGATRLPASVTTPDDAAFERVAITANAPSTMPERQPAIRQPESAPTTLPASLRTAADAGQNSGPDSHPSVTIVSHERTVIKEAFRDTEPEPPPIQTRAVATELPLPERESPVTPATPSVVVQPRVTPLFEDRPAREEKQSAAPAPTIQVTIGRIEVRAVQPRPSPSRARQTPPSLSLEDYLRGRGTGGER